ncbi:MAG: hypothetical protein HN617_03190 [Planctomycetaceae bacterium]|jgi:hypothetical protein|nr:hypothetical protein [Planctomycetaceae bacterium]MBT4011057.1 hypothetical protein [Planctomycetaceae bacterium]MBT4724902.1 hypothetical protein [Planctomycetaceae bacterium]MBT4844415.1 hypothetical protein [Planctomycetaceae bacterium]MBT5123457.1 hypothetical protein [Planctomycetaceae bacterium]
MPQTFEHAELKFLYPENWKIIEQQNDSAICQSVTLQNEGTILWSVYRYDGQMDTEELIGQAVRAIHTEYEDHEETANYQINVGDEELVGIRMFFNYLDFILCMTAVTIFKNDATYMFVIQAESREYDENEIIFQALATSLLNNA